ncbi:MAG: PrpF family protein [Gammaproteobacteria bacterium]|nr:PrpF family protein [Gammaproteobacteria bacterium]
MKKVPAVFMRGGTSKGLFFRAADLPDSPAARDALFLAAMGSPDQYGRQLNGMGGGLSSLSKIAIVDKSARADCDVDFTFGQVLVKRPLVEYGANCGNLSSAVGPFAVDEGLVAVADGDVCVRIHNTNTGKIIHAHFPVEHGESKADGDFVIPGIDGHGAKISLDFLDPAGSACSALLPTGNSVDTLRLADGSDIAVSLIDASMPMVFVEAAAFGLDGSELPADIESDRQRMQRLDEVRRLGAVAMGLADAPENASLAIPKIAMVAGPRRFKAISGTVFQSADANISVRVLSMENAHLAVPLTSTLCVAVAMQIDGSLPNRLAAPGAGTLMIANPSGLLPVDAKVLKTADGWLVERATVYRTARRLFEGRLVLPY